MNLGRAPCERKSRTLLGDNSPSYCGSLHLKTKETPGFVFCEWPLGTTPSFVAAHLGLSSPTLLFFRENCCKIPRRKANAPGSSPGPALEALKWRCPPASRAKGQTRHTPVNSEQKGKSQEEMVSVSVQRAPRQNLS